MTHGHEESDVNVRAILGFGAALVVAAIIIHGMIWLLFGFFTGREAARLAPTYPMAAGHDDQLPPEPRLQSNPRDDLRRLRDREEAVLNGYAWVNKPAGIVRIPIDDAMKLTIQRGLPARPANGAGEK